jgi:hypothetical protein
MRKVMAMAGVAVLALAVSGAAPLLLRAAPPAGPGQAPPAGAAAMPVDMPQQTVKAFAPFLRAVVTRRMNQAERIFKMRRSVQSALEQPNTVRILGRFANKPDQFQLSLIGGRTLGERIGILLFTVATEDGPVAFKVYYYGFGQDTVIARMEVTDDWDEVERLSLTVDNLPQPRWVMLSGQDDAGGQ